MARNIVVGVDGSGDSFAALAGAADLAEQTDARLSLVFVRDPGSAAGLASVYEASAEALIERASTELEGFIRERSFDLLADRPVEWTFDVVVGDAAHMLIDFATKSGASLIVVGGRSHGLLGGLIVGSVAQKLLRSSAISVLVVRRPAVDQQGLDGVETSAV